MRVLAARFRDRDKASMVLDAVQRAARVRPPDVAIAPLGMPGRNGSDETLLAGRIPDEHIPDVVRLVREGGGEIVANVDERWALPRRDDFEPH